MPIVPFQELMVDAFRRRYGVGVMNDANDMTLAAGLPAPEAQTSVKTVKSIGWDVLYVLSTFLKIEYGRPDLVFAVL